MTKLIHESNRNKLISSVVALAMLGIVVVGAKVTANKPQPASSTASQSSTATPTASTSAKTGSYHDGSYMADGSYGSPGGQQHIAVSLTVSGNKVTDSTVVGKATGGVAQFYQKSFIDSYKTFVVGKSLDDITVSRVAGSSLTSIGFKDALKKIKQQAQS